MTTPLREVFARFGIEVDDSKLKHAEHAVDGFAEKLKTVGELLAGGIIVEGLKEFAEKSAEIGHLIERGAIQLGISTDSYQQLGFAAQQSSVDVDEMRMALLQLERQAGEALKGGESAKAFKRLGISIRDAKGEVKPADQLFGEASDKIRGLKSNSEKVAASMEIFGRQGRALLPMLAKGSKGIAELRQEAIDLGGGYDEHAVEASTRFIESLHKQEFSLTSLRGKVASVLLPVLQKIVDATTRAIAWFTKLTKETYLVEVALGALAIALAAFAIKAVIALAPVLAPFVLMGALIGAVILIFEDLIVWFKGGKSAFGEFLNAILGAEKAKAVLEGVRSVVKSISEWVSTIPEHFRAAFKWADDLLNRLQALIGLRTAAIAKGNSEDDRNAMRRQAAVHGQTVSFPGESPEQSAVSNARARAELQAARTIQGGGQALSSAVSNQLTQIFQTGAGMDEERLAKLARREAEGALTDANRAAAQALTREAPAK